VPSEAKAVVIAGRRLQVSAYDRASSLLLALLLVFAAVAAALIFLWMSHAGLFGTAGDEDPASAPLPLVNPNGEGGGNGRAAGGSQLDSPSANEPLAGKDRETTGISDSTVLNGAVAVTVVELDEQEIAAIKRKGNYGKGDGTGGPDGPGDGHDRRIGQPGWPRNWEILFDKNTLDGYAKQLDFFEIELGVLVPNENKIIYVYHLQKRKPDTRVLADALKEDRYYFRWRTGEMQRADEELVKRAGVSSEDRVIIKFLPRETERQLADLEQRYQGLASKTIRSTRFGVTRDGSGFKFVVLEQTKRK
jgi:hypothetical protein